MPLLDNIKRDSGFLQHSCSRCTSILESSNFVICNPLANYKIVQGKLQLITGDTTQLNFTHCHAFGTQGAADTITLSGLTNNTLEKVKQQFPKVFGETQYSVKLTQQFQHRIQLKHPKAKLLQRRIYPLDDVEMAELKKQMQLFLDSNRISPSDSPYGAPILFTRKKDVRLCMCIDYHLLNSQTIPDSFPLPRIKELLYRIGGARYFSKLDLHDGYHKIEVAPEDQEKTAFTCHYGTLQWHIMPIGLRNAPGTFQRTMIKEFIKLQDR